MTSLIRWDPFREITTLREAMDRLFEDAFVFSTRLMAPVRPFGMELDLVEEEDRFVVRASMPGVRPDDLDISLTENTVTIRGELKPDEDIKEEQYHIRERRYGTFSRSITLPAPIDTNAVDAVYEDGVLTLTLPKAEEVRPKKIAVKTHKMIEGQKVAA